MVVASYPSPTPFIPFHCLQCTGCGSPLHPNKPLSGLAIEGKGIARLGIFCYSVLLFCLDLHQISKKRSFAGEGGFEPPIPLQVCRYENRIQWCRLSIENNNIIEIFSQTVHATFGAYGFQGTLYRSLFITLFLQSISV